MSAFDPTRTLVIEYAKSSPHLKSLNSVQFLGSATDGSISYLAGYESIGIMMWAYGVFGHMIHGPPLFGSVEILSNMV